MTSLKQFEFGKFISIAGHQVTLNDDPFLSISLTIFCSGCRFNCKGCQQPLLQDPKNGTMMDFFQIKTIIDKHVDLVDSVCFCGGDWIFYQKFLRKVSSYCKYLKLKTILYTGCLYEQISPEISKNIDVIIDSKFDVSKKQTSFPPSENQRVFLNGKQVCPNELPINQERNE
jgi:pyruvate-formate lyase-activating enzyme